MQIIDPTLIQTWAASPYSLGILSLFSFSESAFFIIPPEVLMLPLSFARPQMALWYALLTTVTSVMGAAFGYYIGVKGGKPILHRLFSEDKIEKVKILFHKYDSWTMIMAAFTPIPFKVFTIAAGVFDLEWKRMLLASAIGRGARYFILGGLIYLFGEPISNFIEHQFDKVLLIGTIALIGGVFIWKFAWPYFEKNILKESLSEKISRWLEFRNK